MLKIGKFIVNTAHITFIEEDAEDLEFVDTGVRIHYVGGDSLFLVGEDEELILKYLEDTRAFIDVQKMYGVSNA